MVRALAGDSTMTRRVLVGSCSALWSGLRRVLADALPGFRLGGLAAAGFGGLGRVAWAGVAPILNTDVPQTGHVPRVAGAPLAV